MHTPRRGSDGYADCFARARVKLESWMRGEPLDVVNLAEDLTQLPDNVCRTLLLGLPAPLSQAVLSSVQEQRR
jgi:hypothetical protein